MAVLYISEFDRMADAGIRRDVAAGQQPRVAAQTVAIGGGSLQSAAFNAKTRFIEVHADAICSFKIGENPTAVTTEGRMAAGDTRYYGVIPGHKIAVITNT